jgi:dihydropteroate synthase
VDVPVSIDTSKAEVARRALALGAELVNDVTALARRSRDGRRCRRAGAYVCLMHMQGAPRTMQASRRTMTSSRTSLPSSRTAPLRGRRRHRRGARPARPGIGFGKTMEQNFELVRRCPSWSRLGRPVVVGFSRKSSLGRVLGDPAAKTGPLAASVAAAGDRVRRGATSCACTTCASTSRRSRSRRRWRDDHRGARVEVFGHHGLNEDERRHGQTFLVDVWLHVPDPSEDLISATIDYRRVRDIVHG